MPLAIELTTPAAASDETTRRDTGPASTVSSSLRWWTAVAATGLCAGVAGIVMTLLLHAVQHVAFGYTENTFLYGVQHASSVRRVCVLTLAGVVAGAGWWLLRRAWRVRTVTEAISPRAVRLPLATTTADALLQIVVVGLGASLGREGAPRQVSGAIGDWFAARGRLGPARRRILIASGAGAGLAAVYNVPAGGCLFAAEVLLGSFSPAVLAPAAIASGVATAVSWTVLPNRPTYDLGELHRSWSLVAFSILIGPVVGLASCGFDTLMSRAAKHRPRSWGILPGALVAFCALGLASIAYPQLLGNGKGPTELALTGSLDAHTAIVLMLLKPLATAACLRGGATGGLLTPSLATGALLGAAAGIGWQNLWPGTQLGSFAFVTAGAMLATTQRAPLCAIALILEFTHTGFSLVPPLLIAVSLARCARFRCGHPCRSRSAGKG